MSESALDFLLITMKDIAEAIRTMAATIILILPITMDLGVITAAIRVIMAAVITGAIMADIMAEEALTEGEAVLVEEEDLAAMAVVTARERLSRYKSKAHIPQSPGACDGALQIRPTALSLVLADRRHTCRPILNAITKKRIHGNERTN
jgi:hypothetical protein